MTPAEIKIWYELLRTLPLHFYRQKPIDNFIADFYCPKLKLIIKIDGDIHFTDKQKKYDKKRTKILETYGLNVIRFTNNEVFKNFNEVCKTVLDLINTKIQS
jgi:very-short-patch-repair endonuclease